ncbi:hypothetical protein D3C76_1409110 [compost metagenome]
MPQVDVFDVAQLSVEEAVYYVELLQFVDPFLRRQQVLPGINALLTCAQRSVQCLRPIADQGKVPIGMHTTQQPTGQQQGATRPAPHPGDRKTYRQYEVSREVRWKGLMV